MRDFVDISVKSLPNNVPQNEALQANFSKNVLNIDSSSFEDLLSRDVSRPELANLILSTGTILETGAKYSLHSTYREISTGLNETTVKPEQIVCVKGTDPLELFLSVISLWELNAIPLLIHTSRTVSYTHLRAHETVLDLVCRLLLEKKK